MIETSVADPAVAPLVGSLPPHCQRDVDTLRRFIRATISREAPAAAVSPSDFKEVLLTGATGFIGRFCLSDLLLQHANLVVHCVVRADKADHGFERLRDALQHAGVWDEEFAPRIRVVVGDLTEVRFGLSEADFAELCQRIDAVYHFAAEISLASSYTAIRKLNTLSNRNVLELCLRTRFKHLFYASTMGVFPQYIFAFAHEFKRSSIDHQMQPDLTEMKRRFPIGLLGYPWSKLTSEQGLLYAQQAGMPLAIFRLPHTNISSTGFVQATDLAVNIFAAVLKAEAMPEGFTFRSAHDESVDTLSRACTAISLNARRRFTIYHCCNPQLDTYELELADFGTYLPEVPYESFKRICQASENSPLNGHWAVLDHFAKYWFSKDKPKDRFPISDRALREDCPHPINWPGVFTKLRHSYRWVMDHPWQWPHPISYGRLDFNCLLTRAERYAEDHGVSFDQVYPTWLRRNLEQLIRVVSASDSMKLEENLPGVIYDFSRLLRNNAAFARERRQRPEIEREEITRPVFIVGINRTGTTFLHRLLARDDRFWAPRVYEYAAPILSQEEYATIGGTPEDPRRRHVKERLGSSEVRERFKGVHDFDIDEPAEDFPILEMVFGSWTSTVRFRIPEYGQWLEANGTRHSYAHHRRIVQHLTWQRYQREPGHNGQWLFKMPIHLMELENLVHTYPDALFIQTHRNPVQFMGSWNSFVERARSIISDSQPRESLGAEQLTFMSGMMDRAVHFRKSHPELEHRWMDVNYVDLVKDPMSVVRSIYERFDWPLRQSAVTAMEDWKFQQAKRRRKEPKHHYDLADYGLTPEDVDSAFAGYREFLLHNGIGQSGL